MKSIEPRRCKEDLSRGRGHIKRKKRNITPPRKRVS